MDNLHYQNGFGNQFASEALADALPQNQNSPQQVPYGLYAEQLSGSAFTVSRSHNLRSWLYRIQPSVLHQPFAPLRHPYLKGESLNTQPLSPNQLRWDPQPYPDQPTDFIAGLIPFAGNGDPHLLQGAAIHLYAITQSMQDTYFYNADGDFLFVPQEGALLLHTELGLLHIAPGEIAVIPRGIKYRLVKQGICVAISKSSKISK